MVRVRFAPSPTGYLHLGGARTALFNYLFAKSHGGKHILRIEDTDRERSTPEAVEAIMQGMAWLNIKYDEGPFFQSERNSIYQDYARKLLELGVAYRCTCTAQRLDQVRQEQTARSEKPQYDKLHRPKDPTPQPTELPSGQDAEPFVIRLRVPDVGEAVFNDLIIGEIRTAYKEIDDFIIIRSDGSPTYNFTVVVDDIEMQITHVIRGMDHISNTPKQMVIYQAFGVKIPDFAHVPMILGPDKQKLSKRHGATSVIEYKKDGYLADAFVNYLARLGWSHGDQEVFTRAELEKYFSLDHVGKSPAVFDQVKLLWVNSEHIKKLELSQLVSELVDFLPERGLRKPNQAELPAFSALVATLRERAKSLIEMADQCKFFLEDQVIYDEQAVKKHLTPEAKSLLQEIQVILTNLKDFDDKTIETACKALVEQKGLKLVQIAQPLRVALTGTAVSPPIFTVMSVLEKERTISRIKSCAI
ncbi:glutamate--tRNA ligase [bacterium]|nr:glutamate--tRNA ligase [bacterium]